MPATLPTALAGPEPVHYLPIATTVLSAVFVATLLRRASRRGWPPHLMWWAVGIFFYGGGTAIESLITLTGNTPTLNRLWFWAGAILGAYPLATGSVYLLLPRRLAHWLTGVSFAFVLFASACVFLTPMDPSLIQPHRPSGDPLAWQWVRWRLSPVINGYAALFLIGGAIWSCVRFLVWRHNLPRALGTGLIALGATLPGIGGGATKAGLVEWLYVGELLGLILIWAGYSICLRAPAPSGGTRVSPAGAAPRSAPPSADASRTAAAGSSPSSARR